MRKIKMIFLRQKHFSNNNYRTRNLNRNNNNTNNNNTRQQTNTNSNRTFNRYQTTRPTSTNSAPFSHPNLIRLANPAYTTATTSSNNNYSNSSNSYLRSATINERLASIGGLFGVLSIVITGALLYAIFTARDEDKQYYVIAVLVNVSILVILMISAILFDRLYLKKLNNNASQISVNSSTNNSNENIIRNSTNNNNITPNTISATYDYLNNANFRVYNDVPPQYPGIIERNELIQSNSTSINNNNNNNNNNPTPITTTVTNPPILQSSIILVNPIKASTTTTANTLNNTKRKANINDRSTSTSTCSTTTSSAYIPSTFNVYLDHSFNKNELIVDDKNKINGNKTTTNSNNMNPPPPNYFDLYPLKENDNTQIILNQNLVLNTSSSLANNNEQAAAAASSPSTSSNSYCDCSPTNNKKK
jgi:hypothetical protein